MFVLQKYVGEVFNIISQQSTAKPGCIIELDTITCFVSMHKDLEKWSVFKQISLWSISIYQ